MKISGKIKIREKWIDVFKIKAIDCYDMDYKISDYIKVFNISKSLITDYLSEKIPSRKIGSKIVLTKQIEEMIITDIDEMRKVGKPLHFTC